VGSFADSQPASAMQSDLARRLSEAGLSLADAEAAARRVAGGAVLVLAQVPADQTGAVAEILGR
jgi:hypothetical protein